MRRIAGLAGALLLTGVLAAPAGAQVNVKINPSKPIVDDAITVTFRTDRVLKPGFHFDIAIIGDSCGFAASFVHESSKRKPPKGTVISMYLSPYDDLVNGGSEWCQGKAFVLVSTARDDGKDGGTGIGTTDFRFYGKP